MKTAGIFAGSGPFDLEQYRAGKAAVEARGLFTREGPNLFARTGFLAGPDRQRAESLSSLARDPGVDVLVAARGGYGLTRIVHTLELPSGQSPSPFAKPIAGFSDVSALHFAAQSLGLPSIHGPVLTQIPRLSDHDVDRFVEVLLGSRPKSLASSGPVLKAGTARGRLWGTNLAVLCAMVGTRFGPSGQEPMILALEDVGETSYRIDRMLTQLRSVSWFDQVVGIALGEFVDCRPAQPFHPTTEDVLRERLSELSIPVLAGFPFGHGERNQAFVLGEEVVLDTERGALLW